MKKNILFALIVLSCDSSENYENNFRVGECPDITTLSTGAVEETGFVPPPSLPGLPSSTAICPDIQDGIVTFCPGSLMSCRQALVVNATNANGSGPLNVHWHGTNESVQQLLDGDYPIQRVRDMIIQENGLLILPIEDSNAVTTMDPFPWWVVCGETLPTECNRPDDFILFDEIVACTIEQNLVSPQRITTSGMSAGGIMVSHLIDRVSYLAGAVVWSGGMPEAYQPTTPAGNAAVMVLHGGTNDVYCGAGTQSCYSFMEPAENFALDITNSGDFAFLCDHQSGHSTSMGGESAEFLRDANINGHPWQEYPFGNPGTGPSWMLNNYCYTAGTQDPWY